MSENVPSIALRGLANALNLTGERSAPPGLELGLPSQPIHDLTPYVRYGSAHRFGKFEDGWVTFALRDTVSIAAFAVTTVDDWSAGVSGAFGVSSGRLADMALWVYRVSLKAAAATALADIGAASLQLDATVGITANSGTLDQHTIFASDGLAANRVLTAALTAQLMNQATGFWPIQWAAGQAAAFRNQNVIANSIVWDWMLLCRMLPMGQAPLP